MNLKWRKLPGHKREARPSSASQCCYAAVRSREGERKRKETWGSPKKREREAWQTVGEAKASSAVLLSAEGAFNSFLKGGEKGRKMGVREHGRAG